MTGAVLTALFKLELDVVRTVGTERVAQRGDHVRSDRTPDLDRRAEGKNTVGVPVASRG